MKNIFGPFFPWRFFRRLYLSQALFLWVVFLSTLVLASILKDEFPDLSEVSLQLLLFLPLTLLFSALFSYRLAVPLRLLIVRALRVADKKLVERIGEEDDWTEEEPGEYAEIGRALERVRKKLKKRRIQLAHEREESETLMRGLEDAVLSFGLDERVKFYNSKFATHFLSDAHLAKLKKQDALLLTDFMREPQVLESFRRCIREGTSEVCQVRLSTRLDNHLRYFSVRVSALMEEKTREIYGALALFHDITDLKKTEQVRIEFVQNASHELRTPLTSIKGFLSTVQEDFKNGNLQQVPHFLGVIQKSVNRLSDLVNDMLTIASLESSVGSKKEDLDPLAITQDVIERLSSLAAFRGIRIHLKTEAGNFHADPQQVEQVLQNLVSNAIKYIYENGQIWIEWQETKSEIILNVKDNGPGIPEAHFARLFERFYRIDQARSRENGGTGLGLAIVKHIMQSHGGKVQVKSSIGQGCEFICSFPKH